MDPLTDIRDIDLQIGDEIAVAFRRSTSVYMRVGTIVEFKSKPVRIYDYSMQSYTWTDEYKIVIKWTAGDGIPMNPDKTSTVDYDSSRIVKIGP